MIECKVYNSTYHVDFTYQLGIQTVNVALPVTATDYPTPMNDLLKLYDNSSGALAYRAVMDSMLDFLKSTVAFSSTGSFHPNIFTRVFDTVLSDTLELRVFAEVNCAYGSKSWDFSQIEEGGIRVRIPPLRQALEDMFQNIIVSLKTIS